MCYELKDPLYLIGKQLFVESGGRIGTISELYFCYSLIHLEGIRQFLDHNHTKHFLLGKQ